MEAHVQPHLSPRLRSLGLLLAAPTVVLAVMLLLPGVALARVGCHPVPDASWVQGMQQVAQPGGAPGAPVTGGGSVYWADDSSGTLDIYAVDLTTLQKTTFAGGAGDQYDPAVCGDLVTWVDDSSGSPMIWAQRTDGSAAWAVSSAPGEHPATDNRYIVWSTPNTADNADIMAYDTVSGQEFTVCDATGAQLHPAVSNGVVVWQDDRAGNWDIYGATIDGTTDTVSAAAPICTADGDQVSPDVYCGLVVWQDGRDCDQDIWGAYVADHLTAGKLVRAPRVGCYDDGTFPIAADCGDQTDPSIDGPLVVWTDARDGADQSDIYAYDFEDGCEFPVCTADGAQTHPDVTDGGTIVWLDGRDAGPEPAVYSATWVPGGDSTDPTPVVTDWTSNDLITLFLSVFNQLGIFSDFRVSFDNGQTWSDWQPFSGIDQLQLPSGDGTKTISLQFEDADGNVWPQTVTITVHLDTQGPTTAARAAVALCGRSAVVHFRVSDKTSPRASVTIKVHTRSGRLVRTIHLGRRTTNRALGATLGRLHRGVYRYTVYATDLAGNHQVKAGSNRLVVR
jgi:beta propeller repeat protein